MWKSVPPTGSFSCKLKSLRLALEQRLKGPHGKWPNPRPYLIKKESYLRAPFALSLRTGFQRVRPLVSLSEFFSFALVSSLCSPNVLPSWPIDCRRFLPLPHPLPLALRSRSLFRSIHVSFWRGLLSRLFTRRCTLVVVFPHYSLGKQT